VRIRRHREDTESSFWATRDSVRKL